FDPSHPGFAGEHFKLEGLAHSPLPKRPVRIMIGGGGPKKVPRLAGTFASEFNIIDVAEFEDMKIRINRAREAAERAGRDPASLLISTVLNVVGVDTEAELEAVIARRADERGISSEEEKKRIAELDIPVGTWDQVYETLHSWEQVGFQRIYLPKWIEPWDSEQAEATFKGLAAYR
ncbi:MAG: LLM class flavin-dependent oxidoreductase, partial [Acidimicrobiia bacterium]